MIEINFLFYGYWNHIMKEITVVKKMETGVAIYYGALEGREFELFNYSELIDMNINALDLLDNPNDYILEIENL